jgi:hypothetical protein
MERMLEWVCPQCSRDVDPALTRCPFCGYQSAQPAADPAAPTGIAPPRPGQRPARRGPARRDWRSFWASVDRGFGFGLGFVAVLAVTYFILYLTAHYGGYGEWAERLARWIFR